MNSSFARLVAAALVAVVGTVAVAQDKPAAERKETIRPEVGKPLQAAQELTRAQKPKEALAKVQEAEAVGNKTPYESYLIDRVRAPAALAAGDTATGIKALEAAIASGRPTQAELVPMIQALAGSYYREKDFAKAAAWSTRFFKEGGYDPQMRLMLIQSYYQNNEFENAAQELLADLQASEKEGKPPPEDRMRLLASSYAKLDDATRYRFALEKLVTYYPKKEYWSELIQRTQKSPTFADRLGLDILRVRLTTGSIEGAEDYMDLAQSALSQGYPAEAKKAIDKGFTDGVLGAGPDADRHKRMREMVDKQLAEDRKSLEGNEQEKVAEAQKDGGLALVNLGFAYVTNGQYDRGLALMERGMAKGGGLVPNKRPQDSRLRLGIAYLLAGQKDKAIASFKDIGGTYGAADIGRLWTIYARSL